MWRNKPNNPNTKFLIFAPLSPPQKKQKKINFLNEKKNFWYLSPKNLFSTQRKIFYTSSKNQMLQTKKPITAT